MTNARLQHGSIATPEQRTAPDRYPVNDVYLSIQGEGQHAGSLVVFVRLQGCPVGCPWCDTRETWVVSENHRAPLPELARGKNHLWTMMPAQRIAEEARSLGGHVRTVVLTGGEPAAYDLTALVDALHEASFEVHIETSGCFFGCLDGALKPLVDWLCVSPKFDMPGGLTPREEVLRQADEIKLVIGKEEDLALADELRAMYAPDRPWRIALQPVSLSPKATRLCVEACKAQGYRLSVQVHQYLALP